MAIGKSIKMYLTIFIATTCIYMVLYQYHISAQPMSNPEILKKQDSVDNDDVSNDNVKESDNNILTSSSTGDLVRRYNLFLWSPVSMFSTQKQQQQQQQQRDQQHQPQLQQKLHDIENSFYELSNATTQEQQPRQQPQKQQQSYLTSSSSSLMPPSLSTSTATSSSSSASLSSSSPSSPSISLASIVIPSKGSTNSERSNNSIDIHRSGNQRNTTRRQSNGDDADDVLNINYKNNNLKKNDEIHPLAFPNYNASTTTTTTTKTTTISITPTWTKSRKTSENSSNFANAPLCQTSRSQTLATVASATASSSSSSSSTTSKMQQTAATTNKSNLKTKFLAESSPPPLYIITPTYRRPEQLAELTRLGYTLKHVSNLLWLVIEDANRTSELVTQTLNRIGVPYEYLIAPMPEEYKKTKKAKPRGVSNRNRGLQWLRKNATEGVFYFADDDNTYDISIFEQMRYTRKVSMWPVGLVTKYGVSSPIIRKGKIDGFYDGWIGGRKYAVDMAGFAVSVKFLHDRPAAKMPFKPGYEEDGFLKSLAPLNNSEIELLASECTEILTWHTQTKKNPPAERLNITKYGNTNLVSIDKVLVRP